LEQERDAAVRCSAWLASTSISIPLIALLKWGTLPRKMPEQLLLLLDARGWIAVTVWTWKPELVSCKTARPKNLLVA
jgi:hypothetical protein